MECKFQSNEINQIDISPIQPKRLKFNDTNNTDEKKSENNFVFIKNHFSNGDDKFSINSSISSRDSPILIEVKIKSK